MKTPFFASNYILIAFLVISTTFPSITQAQVVFRELPNYKLNSADLLFFDITDSRKIISLNGEWKVYSADDEKKNKVNIGVPSVFEGAGDFVFEKTFRLTSEELNKNIIDLHFLGLNYTADVSVNKIIIYRHSGGEFPFSINLPRDILKSGEDNIVSVTLSYKLDSENTIPLKQRFLFPQNLGGIIKDVYLHLVPNINLKNVQLKKSINSTNKKASIEIKSIVENKEFKKINDSIAVPNLFSLRTKAYSPDGKSTILGDEQKFELKSNQEKEFKQTIQISDAQFWSPENPVNYLVRLELYRGDKLIDVTDRSISLYDFFIDENSVSLNGNLFVFEGVTYIPSFSSFSGLTSYQQMEKDLKIIKEAGFNSVRFSKSVPHPYYLRLCEDVGLLALVEIPLNSVPEGLASDLNFIVRSKNYLTNFINSYSKYSSIAAVGLGGGYLHLSDSHRSLLIELANSVKKNSALKTYASFSQSNIDIIENIDLYGIELINKPLSEIKNQLTDTQSKVGVGRFFISEATYTVNIGQTDGYVNEFSYEAQAKYFEELLDFASEQNLSGYFINSMFDVRGDYPSLLSGYDAKFNYNIGLANEERELSRLAFKVISAKLKNAEKVTIPIGSEKDDAPMVFIIAGLLLAILMGILVNSGRKFREDASRALLRPYNFFADVRDQRILSAYHSLFLALIVSITAALLISNILYYFRTSIVFEKILLSFGSPNLMLGVSYLAWNPISSLIWLSLFFIVSIVILTLLVRSASMFVRTKVYTSSAFFAIVWAWLPLGLLIPLGIVLYRILIAEVFVLYIFLLLLIVKIWLIYRTIKGIQVIYDVRAGSVYFYSFLSVILIGGGFLLYFQISSSFFQYILFTLKQFNLIG